MDTRRRHLLARVLLVAFVVLGAAWLARLDTSAKISTDVLDLMPVDERDPALALVRSMAGERQGRIALFVLSTPVDHRDAARLAEAQHGFADALSRSGLFRDVVRPDAPEYRQAVGRTVFERRFDLLLPAWLAEKRRAFAQAATGDAWPHWLAGRVADDLDTWLAVPEAVAFAEALPADPLLLLPRLAEALPDAAAWSAGEGAGELALIWAESIASPLREEGQAPVFAAIEDALASARVVFPEVTLQWTGVSRFAAESRRRIEAEMSMLNIVSLFAVLVVALAGVRRIMRTLHLVPVVLIALLGAWVATTALFDRVHVLVFVIGSLLGGVAIDYGFYLGVQPRREGESYEARVRRLIRPLLSSALTTILGFSLLLFSELPLIRQLGVFVSAGLLSALAGALLWFAQAGDAMLETRRFIRAPIPGAGSRAAGWAAMVVVVAVVTIGPWRLVWRDEIRELEIPAVELWKNDADVRAAFGESGERTVYITRGATPGEARESLEKFLAWHGGARPDVDVFAPGILFPKPDEWAAFTANLDGLGDEFLRGLMAALEKRGFDAAQFSPFADAWRAWLGAQARPGYDAHVRDIVGGLDGPLGLLFGVSERQAWFVSVAPQSGLGEPPPETATITAGQITALNRLFSRYRVSALRLSSIGLGLVGLSVFLIYGVRRGVRIFALPVAACLTAFGLFGLAGQTMNLFHLLGAFLGVCLSHNYAIFSAESLAAGEAPPPSIRLSALTTAASFAVLACSHIPVVAALGAMVAIIVGVALALVEVGTIWRVGGTPASGKRD